MKDAEPIKVVLCDRGEDVETPFADDLGPAPGPEESRRVRLINVPFLHAKPTWGDEIIVSPRDGRLTWDAEGVPWSQIGTRIARDGGRYVMIIDYEPRADDPEGAMAYRALCTACGEVPGEPLTGASIVCEGAWGPRPGKPGRAYLAVREALQPADVMTRLQASTLPFTVTQIHPDPLDP